MANNTNLSPFHLAIQVRNLDEARNFYGEKMGFAEGRSSDQWIDFNMFGHQLVVHCNPALGIDGKVASINNGVDGHGVPVPHFGVVLTLDEWRTLATRVQSFIDHFIIEPYVRFEGEIGEQATMFFSDPSGNAIEFKAFQDRDTQLFAKE
ncbi:glyoxalase [Marinomonas agarivorans]|nr:glyoxalase [Marinomonas agarivorans]